MNNGIKVLWLLSIFAAVFLGYSISPITTINENYISPLIEQPKFKDYDRKIEENIQLKQTTKLEMISPTIIVNPDLNDLLDDLQHLLTGGQLSTDMAAIAKAYGLIENLTEDELLATLHLMKGEINKPNNRQIISLLIGRLATFDPMKAVNFVEDNVNTPQAKMMVMMSILSTWVKEDPISAYYWYVDPNNGNTSNNTFASMGLLSIFNGLATQDTNDAFAKLTELDNSGRNISMATMGFSQSLESKEDFLQFIERSAELDNLKTKNSLISSWVQKSPLEVIEWLESIEEPTQQKKLQSTVFMTWAFAEPTNAADWYIGKATESEKQSHAAKIIQMWGRREPNAALAWLDQQTSFDTQKPIVKLLDSSTYHNPKFSIDNLERLTNDKDKAKVSHGIYRSLKRSSTNKAADFLASSPYKDEIEKKQRKVETYKKKKALGY